MVILKQKVINYFKAVGVKRMGELIKLGSSCCVL